MQPEPVAPRRVRVPRGAYGWVDLKVITGGWLEGLGPDTALTYLFFCAVGNSRGVSFWSRGRMAQTLGISPEAIDAAIGKLVRADLIATRDRIVQVLSLPASAPESPPATAAPAAPAVAVTEEEIAAHLTAARAKLGSFRQGNESLPSVVRALATSMARADKQQRLSSSALAQQGGEARG